MTGRIAEHADNTATALTVRIAPDRMALICEHLEFPDFLVAGLLYTTGIRPDEAFALRRSDIVLSKRILKIRGRGIGPRRREVLFPAPLKPALAGAMKIVEGRYLFRNSENAGRRFYLNLERACNATGIPGTVANLRGSFAEGLLNQGIPLREIRRVMGESI